MEKYCMVDKPLNSSKNTELGYLAQVLLAPLFTLHAVIHISLMILKKPTKQCAINQRLVVSKLSSSYTFFLLKTTS